MLMYFLNVDLYLLVTIDKIINKLYNNAHWINKIKSNQV